MKLYFGKIGTTRYVIEIIRKAAGFVEADFKAADKWGDTVGSFTRTFNPEDCDAHISNELIEEFKSEQGE